jgi:hypothetical protein
VDKNFA